MKCYKFCIVLLLCVGLIVKPSESDVLGLDSDAQANVYNAALPAMAGLVGMCVTAVPVGPLLVLGLGLLHVATMVLNGIQKDGGADQPLTKIDLSRSQAMVNSKIENLHQDMKESFTKINRELQQFIKEHFLLEDMRKDCSDIQRKCTDKMKLLMNSKATGVQKNAVIAGLLDLDSPLLGLLRSFIDKYITPSVVLPSSSGPSDCFFEIMLEKDRLLALENKDAHTDSTHSTLFKSYMYLVKLLTEGYVAPLIAHAMQYQKEIQGNLTSDAETTKSNADDLLNDYKNNMKSLIDKTKWGLDKASRDVRNSGVFELVKGKTFERLSACTTIPRIMSLSQNGCKEEEAILNLKDFETGNCNTYGDIILPNSQLSIYSDPHDIERPYQYMKVVSPDGSEEQFGHVNSDSSLVEQQVTISDQCPTVFCPAYKKNEFAISTQRIRADSGNAITGLRFRVENKTLSIDIQQGKIIDILSVEPDRYWTKTPADGPVAFLSARLKNLEVGVFEVEDGDVLRSIQLKQGNAKYGTINVIVEGSKGPNHYVSSPIGSTDKIPQSNEIRDPEADDAEKAGDSVKSMISASPIEGERSYISLQPTNIKKDMGRTCYPLIDIREVISATPLCGFGIYHDTLGIIGLRGITCKLGHLADYSQIEAFTKVAAIA